VVSPHVEEDKGSLSIYFKLGPARRKRGTAKTSGLEKKSFGGKWEVTKNLALFYFGEKKPGVSCGLREKKKEEAAPACRKKEKPRH